MKPRYVVLGTDVTDYVDAAYDALRHMDDVFVASYRSRGLTGVPSLGRRIRHDAGKLLRSRGMTEETLWQDLGRGWDGTILFFECDWGQERIYLEELRSCYPKARLVMYVLNPIYEMNAYLKERIDGVGDLYDLIVTCNRRDADRFGWGFFPLCYSPVPANEIAGDVPASDLCFLGQTKTREEQLWQVYQTMTEAGLTCDFVLVGEGDLGIGAEKATGGHHEAPGFVHREGFMPYREYLGHIRTSRCLLEMTVAESPYATLRTMEALTYGKKLLTTNGSIRGEDYFDPACMRVVAPMAAGGGDVRFVRESFEPSGDEVERVRERFSPRRLLAYINSQME